LDTRSLWIADEFFGAVDGKSAVRVFPGAPEGRWDFIFLDLGHTPQRADYLPTAWERLREGGLMLIDDVHHAPYRARVAEFLAGVPHERIDVHEATRDKFGRYAWLVRRAA